MGVPKGYKQSPEHKAKLRVHLAKLWEARRAKKTCPYGHLLVQGRTSRYCATCHTDARLKRQLGISWEEKKAMYDKQRGLCGCCGLPLPKLSKSNTDHSHTTGTVRELLHQRCNFLVGILEANPTLFKSVGEYVERWDGK